MHDNEHNAAEVKGVGYRENVDIREDFAAMEQLPAEVRRALAEYPFKISAVDVLGYLHAALQSQFVLFAPTDERHDLAAGMTVNAIRESCKRATQMAYEEFGHDDVLPSMLKPI